MAICGRDQSKLAAAEKTINLASAEAGFSIKAFSRSIDLADVEQTKSFATTILEEFGQVDVLVNNAAIAPNAEIENMSDESFESTTDVNIRSVFYLTREVWKAMKSGLKGAASPTVVNVSSLAAVDPFPGFSVYGASKAWIELFSQSLAAEGESHGIRVCSVRPGAVETPLLRGLFPDYPAEQCVSPEAVAEVIWGCVADPQRYPSGGHFPVTVDPEQK